MKLTIVWSLQARNQYIASLAHISTDDPQTAALVDKRVGKSLQLLSEFPDMGLCLLRQPVCVPTQYPRQVTVLTIDGCGIRFEFSAGIDNDRYRSLTKAQTKLRLFDLPRITCAEPAGGDFISH